MFYKLYDTNPGVLVLSADLAGGFMSPQAMINHVTLTRIYGDGKVVFVDPAKGSTEICEGHLDTRQITQLFELLQGKGFFGFAESYFESGPTDMPTYIVTATRWGEHEKRVGCYGGPVSAPPGFMDCYQALRYPQIHPSSVQTYVRQPITDHDLAAGFYYGFEYQKKLNTPQDWVWIEAGRSSQWRRPEAQPHTVTLDSGFMTPAVDGCRHIAIRYSHDPAAAGGTIQFDRNAMSPDAFGDIGVTTLIYFAPRPTTFTLIEAKADKHLYSVTVPGYTGPALRLVVLGDLARPSGGRLLVVDASGAIQDIHPLVLPT